MDQLTTSQRHDLQSLMRMLQKEIHQNALSKGFWEPLRQYPHLRALSQKIHLLSEDERRELLELGGRNAGDAHSLFHTEISESYENVRDDYKPDDKVPAYPGSAVELADAIVRIFDWAEGKGLDVIGALFAKMEYNKTRPRLHGRSL